MEKINKKLKKHIIEKNLNILLAFKIPDVNDNDIVIFKFDKIYPKGKKFYFGGTSKLIDQFRYLHLKEISKLLLYKEEIEKLSKKQIKLYEIMYKRLNYLGIKKISLSIEKFLIDLSFLEFYSNFLFLR